MPRWILFALLAVLLPAAVSATPAEARLNEMLKGSMHPGAHDFEIINFLTANRFPYSRSGNSINVTLQHSLQDALVQGTVHMQFLLDAHNQLTGYSVKEDLPAAAGKPASAGTNNTHSGNQAGQ